MRLMQSSDFLAELDRAVQSRLDQIAESGAGAEPGPSLGVPELLATALKKELEATEEAALWLVSEPDVEVKLALARQCGDEARHYRLIEARLRELGVDPAKVQAQSGEPSPMFKYLETLTTTVERVAAGQFTREALARVLNEAFIAYCESKGDSVTASLYRDVIQPDEAHHHELGRKLLLRLAVTDDEQGRARTAALRTLAIAQEIQELARLKKGIARAPGC